MAKSVKETATNASARCQRERETESAEQKRVRKTGGSNFVRRLVGNARNGAAARGPPCERNIAWSVGVSVGHVSERCRISRLRAANFCHPC